MRQLNDQFIIIINQLIKNKNNNSKAVKFFTMHFIIQTKKKKMAKIKMKSHEIVILLKCAIKFILLNLDFE